MKQESYLPINWSWKWSLVTAISSKVELKQTSINWDILGQNIYF